MNAASLIDLALNILQAVLAQSKESNVAAEVIQGIEAAIAELAKVHGTDVTMAQLENLRVKQVF